MNPGDPAQRDFARKCDIRDHGFPSGYGDANLVERYYGEYARAKRKENERSSLRAQATFAASCAALMFVVLAALVVALLSRGWYETFETVEMITTPPDEDSRWGLIVPPQHCVTCPKRECGAAQICWTVDAQVTMWIPDGKQTLGVPWFWTKRSGHTRYRTQYPEHITRFSLSSPEGARYATDRGPVHIEASGASLTCSWVSETTWDDEAHTCTHHPSERTVVFAWMIVFLVAFLGCVVWLSFVLTFAYC